VSVREAPTASVLTRSRPAESHKHRRQLFWRCGGTCHLRREGLRREQLASDRMKARQKRLIIPTGSSASCSEDDGGSRRQKGATPGGCSGRAALRRGQCDILGFLGNMTYIPVAFP
jgi:hypothetical protein